MPAYGRDSSYLKLLSNTDLCNVNGFLPVTPMKIDEIESGDNEIERCDVTAWSIFKNWYLILVSIEKGQFRINKKGIHQKR